MNAPLRIVLALVITSALLVVSGLVAYAPLPDPDALAYPPDITLRVNRIAYVGPGGVIKAVKPDLSDTWQVSPPRGFYTWPTWSPDGRKISYSGATQLDNNSARFALHEFDTINKSSREYYVGEPGVAVPLANGVVHYTQWSPDSNQIAFVSGTNIGLSLFISDFRAEGEPRHILDSGPLWTSWSPTSEHLIVHRGQDHFLIDTRHEPITLGLRLFTDEYRVPTWHPQRSAVTLAVSDANRNLNLVEADVVDGEIGETRRIRSGVDSPVYLWSPNGEQLAVASANRVLLYQNFTLLVQQDLAIIRPDDPASEINVVGNVLAYFWSPDGSKLAIAELSTTPGQLIWRILDAETGETWPIVEFVPSLDQLTMFQFFDQYAHSHTLWSPDSEFLVFAGTLSSDSITASTSQPSSQIYVVDVMPSAASPSAIADGTLAIWSPN